MSHRLVAYLACPFACHAVLPPYLCKRSGRNANAVEGTDDIPLTLPQLLNDIAQLRLQAVCRDGIVCLRGFTVAQHIRHGDCLTSGKRGVNRTLAGTRRHRLHHVWLGNGSPGCHLVDVRTTLVLLFEERAKTIQTIELRDMCGRDTHDAALLCDGILHCLTDMPDGKGDKTAATRGVELVNSLYQTDIALIDKVGDGKTFVAVLACDTEHMAQVG